MLCNCLQIKVKENSLFFSNRLEAGQCILDTESVDNHVVVWVDDVTHNTLDGIIRFFIDINLCM